MVYENVSQNERSWLRAAIEVVQDAVVVAGVDGTIQFVNQAMVESSGYSREELIGENPRMLQSGVQGRGFYKKFWATLASGEAWEGYLVNRRKSGELYTEFVTITPVEDEGGLVSSYVAVKKDLSVQSSLQRQVHMAQRLESVGRLAAGMTHELNDILSGIQTFAELAAQSVEDPQVRADLDEILRGAKQAAAVTNQLLGLANESLSTGVEMVRLPQELTRAISRVRPLLGESVEVEWNPPPQVVSVSLPRAMLVQLVSNLLVHARDAMNGSGTVKIEMEAVEIQEPTALVSNEIPAGEYAKVSVSDSGMGVEPDSIATIFTPFFSAREDSEGLGLSVVCRAVQQAGGGVDVESVVGEGTTFHVYLPCQGEQVGSLDDDVTDAREIMDATVLLVASDAAFAARGLQMLESLGATVLVALNAPEAIDLSLEYEGSIDVLIAELELPESDGPALRQRLNQDRPDMECIFVVGYSTHALVDPILAERHVSLLERPLSISPLRKMLVEVLSHDRSGSD